MKRYMLILFLCIVVNEIYSFSPKVESFYIKNCSSYDLIVEYEFWEEDHGSAVTNYLFEQVVHGMGLTVRDYISSVENNIIRPNRSRTIIQYYPQGALIEKNYEGMYNIPLMDKINAIFKSLIIRSTDGKITIDLNNLENMYVKKWGGKDTGEIAYILEITDDYDLETKRASEW